jgi:DNA helicase-2/ATP-dependent DNA helicase PcrA
VSIWGALSEGAAALGLSGAAAKRVDQFREAAAAWHEMRESPEVTSLLARILEDTSYTSFLENLPGDDARSRIENVHELLTVSQNFDAQYDARELDEEDPKLGALAAFLEQLTLASEVDTYESRANAVTLMTVHNSKGLEFDHVFVVGLEEGIFPHGRSTNGGTETGVEEERRLCYVAITRARKELTLTYAVRRHLYGMTQFNFPSRFLEEIPGDRFAQERHREPRILDAPVIQTADVHLHAENTDTAGKYRVGMRVVHPMFGVGTVRACDRSGKDEKLVVHFQRAGIKKLVARFARLEIV